MLKLFSSLGDKGKDVQGLLEKSVTLLGKDVDVFKPAIYMTVIKSINISIFFSLSIRFLFLKIWHMVFLR